MGTATRAAVTRLKYCRYGIKHFKINQSITITSEGLQLLTYTWHSWPFSSEGSLACHTYCDTGHTFIMVISKDPWHSHLLASVWQWSCHYLFNEFSMSQLETPNLLHAGRMLSPTLPLLRPMKVYTYLQWHQYYDSVQVSSDTITVTVYKNLQWHQHSDSVHVSTVTTILWQCTSIYIDINNRTEYKYLQWQQQYDSVQVSTVTKMLWQCTSVYSDTYTVIVYMYLHWSLYLKWKFIIFIFEWNLLHL